MEKKGPPPPHKLYDGVNLDTRNNQAATQGSH